MNRFFRATETPSLAGPVVFLAGPIQGSEPWQERAGELLLTASPDLWVASPRRERFPEGDADAYAAQVDWETEYLHRAGAHGVVLFWLAREATIHPERAYAQTTRFELAEWKMRHQYEGAKLVIGIEEGFSGARYIRRRMGQDCPGVPILDSLEATCAAAVALLADQPATTAAS